MKKKIVSTSNIVLIHSLLILNLCTINSFASNYYDTIIFGGSNRDYLESIAPTVDRGFAVAGYSYSNDAGFTNNGNDDAIVVKYNELNEEEWIKSFGGSKADSFKSIIETSDKGLVSVGYSESSNENINNNGYKDGVIVKYSDDGNLLWNKNFGGSDSDYFDAIIETSDRGLIAIGYSNSTNGGFENKGNYDAIIVKYDEDGNEQWVKSWGGSSDDRFFAATETFDNGILVVGYSYSKDSNFANQGSYDAILVKYNQNGEEEWVKSLGGSDSERFNSIIELSDKSFIVVGESSSPNMDFSNLGANDAIIAKYDENGNKEWIKNWGGSNSDSFKSVCLTTEGKIIAIGNSSSSNAGFESYGNSDGILIKYDKDGNQEEIKNFGFSNVDQLYSVSETLDGSLMIVGHSNLLDSEIEGKGGIDGLIIKVSTKTIEEQAVIKAQKTLDINDISIARDLVNKMDESSNKDILTEILNSLFPNTDLERETASANVDVYVKSDNMLSLSLDTNSVTFENFSGVEDMEMSNAINLTVNSSLPYKVNAYLTSEIQNTNKSETIDKDILNIKANGQNNYNTFVDTTTPIVLLDDQSSGNNKIHGIDLMLKSNIAHEKDIYKTTIKFEIVQK